MPAAGWYPDPDQTPGRYRYWDGTAWTEQTRETAGGNGRRRGLVIGVLALVIIVGVITSVAVIRSRRDPVITDGYPESTASSWNDSSPLPTASPTPSRQACDAYDTSRTPAEPADGRAHGGPLSFALLGGAWSKPYASNAFPFSRNAYVQTEDMKQKLPWQASVEVGQDTMKPYPGSDAATAMLLRCLVTSDFYTGVHVKITRNTSKPVMIGDTRAVQRDALLRFHHPDLTTTGSLIRIIVVDSKPVTFFFSAVPMERSDVISDVDRATDSLRVGGR